MAHKLRITMVGGTGYLGQKIGQRLANEGHQLTLTTRNPEKWHHATSFPCQLIAWDPKVDAFPMDPQEPPHVVINLAGAGIADQRWTEKYQKELRDSRIVTTRKIATGIREANERAAAAKKGTNKSLPPIHLVQASAIGYYGSRGEQSVDETSPRGEGFLAGLCYDWEQEALRAKSQDNRVVILRIGVVVGIGGGFLDTMMPLYMRGVGAILGSDQQAFPWVHESDVIAIFTRACADAKMNGVYNTTAPDASKNRDFHELMVGYFGTQFAPRVPEWGVRAILGKQAEIATISSRAIPKALLDLGFKFNYTSLATAMEKHFNTEEDQRSYQLISQQWLPYKREEVWPFFATETNLEILTPDWLSFKVLSKSTPDLGAETVLSYQLKLHGIPIKWKTLILEWDKDRKFVDLQTSGPYALWHHSHFFEDLAGGTLLTDHVRMRLPMGKLGFLAASPLVISDVKKIFSYRKQKIAEIFAKKPPNPSSR